MPTYNNHYAEKCDADNNSTLETCTQAKTSSEDMVTGTPTLITCIRFHSSLQNAMTEMCTSSAMGTTHDHFPFSSCVIQLCPLCDSLNEIRLYYLLLAVCSFLTHPRPYSTHVCTQVHTHMHVRSCTHIHTHTHQHTHTHTHTHTNTHTHNTLTHTHTHTHQQTHTHTHTQHTHTHIHTNKHTHTHMFMHTHTHTPHTHTGSRCSQPQHWLH
jgi:hypothetical protein